MVKHLQSLTECEVQGLGGEVPNDVGGVTTPEGDKTLILVGTGKAVGDALVGGSKTTLLDLYRHVTLINRLIVEIKRAITHHLVLVLHQELDTLDGGSGRFGDGLCTTIDSVHNPATPET